MANDVAANSRKGSMKVCMFLKRKNGMSHDEFNQYWTEKHTPLIQDWLPKHGISRDTQVCQHYEALRLSSNRMFCLKNPRARPSNLFSLQFHTSPSFQQQCISKVADLQHMKPLDYDGIVEMVMPDVQCLANARKDQLYQNTVRPSEEKFIEVSQTQYMVGWQETIVHKGRAVGDAKSHYFDNADHGGDEGVGVEHARDDV